MLSLKNSRIQNSPDNDTAREILPPLSRSQKCFDYIYKINCTCIVFYIAYYYMLDFAFFSNFVIKKTNGVFAKDKIITTAIHVL